MFITQSIVLALHDVIVIMPMLYSIAKKPLLPRSHIPPIRQLSLSLAFVELGHTYYVHVGLHNAYTSIRHRYTNIPLFTLVNTSTVITGLNK